MCIRDRGKEDSDLLDGPLIETFSRLDRVLNRGVSAMEFEWNGRLQIGPNSVEVIDGMKERTPPSQQVRISGKLETIRHSDRRFVVLQKAGSIPGIAEEKISPKVLASLFGQPVTISGTAHFRPSGSLLRVDADSVQLAAGDVSLWAQPPTPLLHVEKTTDLHRIQGSRSGVSAIFGKWPGDEDDDAIEEALRELS